MDLRGRVAVVTGASSGIGRRVTLDLAARGATVCAVARRADRLRALVEELGGAPHTWLKADVSSPDDVAGLAEHVAGAHGRCDVLVNNAGIARPRPLAAPDAMEAFESVIATNLVGPARCTHALLPLLAASAPSSVVNVASVAGFLPFKGGSTYCASKHGLVGWSEALRAELAPDGVWVSLIEPGPLPTEGFPQTRLGRSPVLRRTMTSVEEVSAAVLSCISKRRPERVIPRWYHLIRVLRVLAPRLYRALQAPAAGAR